MLSNVIFNDHSKLKGQHAFLSASQYHWLNYSEEKIAERYSNFLATLKGTQLHEFAAEAIRLGIKLPKTKQTLNMYVNDAIGFRMRPEQTLYYSDNCYGTADAISYKNKFLRIHDLKTGVSQTSMNQPLVYAALFCLEYKIKPGDIQTELRIYQNDDFEVWNPVADDILPVMDTIVTFDKIIDNIKLKEG